MSSMSGSHSGRTPSHPYRPRATGRTWLRSAVPAVLVAAVVFGLGVVAGSAPSFLPKGLLPAEQTPIQLDVDSLVELPQPTLLERVAEGEAKAIAELRAKSSETLSVDEALALDDLARRKFEERVIVLGRELQTKRPEEISPEAIADMMDYAGEPATRRVALEQLAKIPNFLGADLIYKASRTHRRDAELVDLADALLSTAEVRGRASPAMSVVIDAMHLKTCEQARDVLKRASEDGDRRSVPHLAPLGESTGCGPSKIDDCYECLRVDRLLVDSVRLAQERIEPY
jgi:hypothetical protein